MRPNLFDVVERKTHKNAFAFMVTNSNELDSTDK